MVHVIPTIFSYDKKGFFERFGRLVKASKYLQIDFMDGKFVKSKSVPLSVVPDLKKFNNYFEAHLMVSNPQTWISKLKIKGFKKVIFHYEAMSSNEEIFSLVEKIKSSGMKAFIAVNPGTSVANVERFVPFVDGFLLMGVHPGLENQSLISSTYDHIRSLRKFSNEIVIQVDGGVTFDTAERLSRASVNLVNSGSLVYNAYDPKKVIKRLEGFFK